ncbi:MAG: hypothetical protein A2096_12005 [Spirochaetes bacterium GWF1_41_5]|nr:MAG: hypothetical protein A2096_12005 [Spirochaetes bacterium GWF1_41_5]
MKFLIIGLGSMGKRRIRCLQSLKYHEISGFDLRADRRDETRQKYGIKVFDNFEKAAAETHPDALIISVPPDKHLQYMEYCIEKKIHFFVEASVVDHGMKNLIKKLEKSGITAAPSATMMFHPAIMAIKNIVDSRELGKLSNVLLHSGQFLPDWHTYEKVSEYYVSNPATGGGREIVPFELTWFTMVFGMPKRVGGNFRKTINIEGAEKIDDTYNCLLDYEDFLSVVTVDVVSRYATRRLTVNGDQKQLYWSWDENCVKVYDPASDKWEQRGYEMKNAQSGYNANIGENMYIDEISNFIDAVSGKRAFINTMSMDYKVLQLLYKIEKSDKNSLLVRV